MLQFDNVTVRYGARTALSSVTCGVAPGALVGLIGPNGSGKTTWLKAAAGLLAPAQGRILFDGQDVLTMPPRRRAQRIAYMPQVREVPDMTVRQLAACGRYPHVAFGGKLTQQDTDLVEQAMEAAGVTPFAYRPMRDLSGGEQQRVYVAMMLAQQTDVLLLDEPANHLDPARQMETAAMLSGIARAGKTVLMTVHNLPLALQCCDELLLLNNGTLAGRGGPTDNALRHAVQRVFGILLHHTPQGLIVQQGSPAGPVSG